MTRNARGPLPVPFLLLFLLSFSLIAAPTAHAVQTGGSISLYPTDWGRLATGDLVDVVVTLNNTSSDTPASDFPDGVDPVPAKLSGDVTVFLALNGPECTDHVPGKLAFVPVGASGCVDKDNNVISCAASGTDSVVITLKPAGITLPASGNVDVATIRVQVIDTQNIVQLGIKGVTENDGLRACSTSAPSICAECGAKGCTTLLFVDDTGITGCPHDCPARIIYRGNAATPDFFEFHGLIRPGPISPPTEPFTVSLRNSQYNPVFTYTIPPGSLTQQGDGTFTYRNNSARNGGGIAFVKIAKRDGLPVTYKVDIQVLDARLESRTMVPEMTVTFSIGDDVFTTTNLWTKKPNGWFLNLTR